MSILSVFDLFSFLIYASLGLYILAKNPDAALNRLFFGITCCFVVLAFASVFYDDPRSSEEAAKLSIKIASLGWLSFGSLVFLFCVFFSEKISKIPLKKLSVILIAVPVVLIFQQWHNESLISDITRQPYGWADIWQNSVWTYVYFVYYSLTTGFGLLLVFDYWRKTDKPEVKHQAAIIFVTGMFALIIGSLINVILPLFNIFRIPAIGHLMSLIWVAGIAYVIIRYRFLTISPATAAENILSTMTEALILLDPTGQIVIVNKATCDFLGYKIEEIEGRMFEEVFESPNDSVQLLKDLQLKEAVRNLEFSFITKDKKNFPVILSVLSCNIDLLRLKLAENDDIHIEKTLEINLPDVIADQDQMEMVLHIILSNASEAMQGKGRIQISVNNVEISKDDEQLLAGVRAGHYVCLTVTDDGEGMDEQTLKQIFDPFFSTKILGRGLGMAAVYGVVKNHEGFIDVLS